jgi:hypothetical protein
MFINDGARLDIFSENMSIGSGFQCEPTGELSLTLMVEVIIFLECNLILSTSSVLIFLQICRDGRGRGANERRCRLTACLLLEKAHEVEVPEVIDVAAMGIALINSRASYRIQIIASNHSKVVPFDSNFSTRFLLLL